MTNEHYDVAVVGAGPAGLFCAINTATPDHRILVLEKMNSPGRKLLISGTGQCNITHDGNILNFLSHYGSNGKFLRPALLSFSNRDLTAFFKDHGVATETESGGKVFPVSRSSADVLDGIIRECGNQNVILRCNEAVTRINRQQKDFEIVTSQATYHAKFVVIATGGASYPATGSSGDGYRFAAGMGHTVREIAPALTPLYIKDFPFADLAGMSFSAMHCSVWRKGKNVIAFRGDVLFTHKGLSGPGILDMSRTIRSGDVIRLSFVGTLRQEEFARGFVEQVKSNGSRQVKSVLSSYNIPQRLVGKVLDLAGTSPYLTCSHLSVPLRLRLITHFTEFPLTVDTPGDFSVAMVTQGGVSLDEVNPKTMESRKVKNLFFVGEVLDYDGDTGGYNLQAAFSTGMLAARSIRKRYDQDTPLLHANA